MPDFPISIPGKGQGMVGACGCVLMLSLIFMTVHAGGIKRRNKYGDEIYEEKSR